MRRWKLLPVVLALGLAAPAARAADAPVDYVDELNFYNTDLHLVLQALHERTGHTFVEDVPVQGKVTVHVSKRTPIPEILDQILRGLNLSWKLVGGVYHVGLKLPVKGAPLGKGLLAKTYELKDVPADEAAEAVRALLSEYGKVTVDPGLNTVTVTDIAEVHDNVKVKLDGVDVLDKRPARINIRAKVLHIQTEETDSVEAGLAWSKYNANEGLASDFVNANTAGSSAISSNGFFFTVGQYGIDDFVTWFWMHQSTAKLNVLAEPDVTVPPGESANFEVGEKLGQEIGGRFDFDKIGVIMYVKPYQPNAETGVIELEITPEIISDTGQSSGGDKLLSQRKISTVVEIPSGGTMRIGGLVYTEENENEKKVPVLGDLPLLGFLFKDRLKTRFRNEIVVLISPRILERIPPRCATTAGISALSASLLAGTTDVMLDWAEDVPFDNVGVVRYHVYRDVKPIVHTVGMAPLERAARGDVTSWVDRTPKRRGVTYHYAVTGVDGADNEQAVSNTPSVTIPRR